MSTAEFRLPDVGEGLTEAEIVAWHVAVGDQVKINQIVVEIETAKAQVELPSPHEGTVTELLVAEGDTVPVGDPLLRVETTPNSDPATDKRPSVLVGYGPSQQRTKRRPRTTQPATPPPRPVGQRSAVLAKPPVRKFAKDLGVDLASITPTCQDQPISRAEVLKHAERTTATTAATADAVPASNGHADRGDPEATRIPVKGVRKATAAAMVASAFTAPHVTEFLTVDVTKTVKLVGKLKHDLRFADLKVTPLLIVSRAVIAAVRQFPEINACWDDQSSEIVLKHDVNLGIAAATPRGLVVPNIKRADQMGLRELADAIADLVGTARDGKTEVKDMTGGTITITNVGVFGVDAATPIINPGESAILCLGAVQQTPWNHRGKIALRWTTQLSLSFDHRLVDGELGSKVLATVGSILNRPEWELLMA